MKSLITYFGVLFLYLILGCSAQFEPDMWLIEQMSLVTNVTGWCALMNFPDCEKVIAEAIPDVVVDENGEKIAVSGHEKRNTIAVFDACDPREMTIALPRHPDPAITIWPTCTRTMRCGGCCTSEVFSCEPTEIRESYVKVFDTRLPYPGAHRFQFLGLRSVKVIQHLQCDAQCKTKQHECHKYQRYEARNCRCECRAERLKLKSTCSSVQIWDDSECDCICPNRNTASCPPPSYFSTTTCKCTLKTEVTGEIDLAVLFERLTNGKIGGDFKLLSNPTNEIDNEEIDNIAAGEDISKGDDEDYDETEDGEWEAGTEESESSKDNDESSQVENDTSQKEGDGEGEDDGSHVENGQVSGKEVYNEVNTDEENAADVAEVEEQTTKPAPKPKPKPKDCSEMRCAGMWVPKLFHGSCRCFPPSRH